MNIAFILISLMININNQKETIVLGGGCFWCTEAIYSQVKGVLSVTPGYSGGETKKPSYTEVCTGETVHAEVVKIEFDPHLVSITTLLEIFFNTHDPSTLNRQGADVGTQYRSVIFYTSDKQKEIAQKIIERINNEKVFLNPIVTEVSPLTTFHEAEKYHQDYYLLNRGQPYCQFVIRPKLEKFRKMFDTINVK